MRHRAFELTPLLIVAALTAACGETPSDPAFDEVDRQAARAATAGSRGAVVEVDETTLLFLHFDAARDLYSVHAPADLCTTFDINVGVRRIVTTPSEIRQRIVQIKDGDSGVSIFRADTPPDIRTFADLCSFLADGDLVAEGTVRHTQVLSNGSFTAHWGGPVEAVDGDGLHLSEVYQLTADVRDPNNPATFSLNASKVLLSPGR